MKICNEPPQTSVSNSYNFDFRYDDFLLNEDRFSNKKFTLY